MSVEKPVIEALDAFEASVGYREVKRDAVVASIRTLMQNKAVFEQTLVEQPDEQLQGNLRRTIRGKERKIQQVAHRHAQENGVPYAAKLLIYYAEQGLERE